MSCFTDCLASAFQSFTISSTPVQRVQQERSLPKKTAPIERLSSDIQAHIAQHLSIDDTAKYIRASKPLAQIRLQGYPLPSTHFRYMENGRYVERYVKQMKYDFGKLPPYTRSICISENHFLSHIPAFVEKFPHLHAVTVAIPPAQQPRRFNELLAPLFQLQELHKLRLEQFISLDASLLKNIAKIPKLQTLHISQTRVSGWYDNAPFFTDQSLETLSTSSQLLNLQLRCTFGKVTTQGFSHLGKLIHLRDLLIKQEAVIGHMNPEILQQDPLIQFNRRDDLSKLLVLPKLRYLVLVSKNFRITDDQCTALLQCFPDLHGVQISKCQHITKKALQNIAARQKITRIIIGCPEIAEEQVKQIFDTQQHLQEIYLRNKKWTRK